MPPPRRAKKGPPPKIAAPTGSKSASAGQSGGVKLEEENQNDPLERFPVELRWCLQNLEMTIEKKKDTKEAEDLVKSYKILSGKKAPLIKKRQLMRNLFGDYREKMAKEEAKAKVVKPSLKGSSAAPTKSKYIKQKGDSNSEPNVENVPNDSNTSDTHTEAKSDVLTKSEDNVQSKLQFNSEDGKSFKFNFSVPD